MVIRIKKIEPMPDYKLKVEFDDGKVVIYDVCEDIRQIPSFAPLTAVYRLFEQVQLDTSRTCIFWNDEIDLPSDTLYKYGEEVPPEEIRAHDTAMKEYLAGELTPHEMINWD